MNNNSQSNGGGARTRNRIWQFVRFVVITGVIFAISLFVMNIRAYHNILSSILNPGEHQIKEDILEPETEVDPDLFLHATEHQKGNVRHYQPEISVMPTDSRIVIPSLAISAPIKQLDNGVELIQGSQWDMLDDAFLDRLNDGTVQYPGSAMAGRPGNNVITGHSSSLNMLNEFSEVFSMLPQIEEGDNYYVYTPDENGAMQRHEYIVTKTYEVLPHEVEVLAQDTSVKQGTLITCTPVGFAHRRFIAESELVESKYTPANTNESDAPMLPELPVAV